MPAADGGSGAEASDGPGGEPTGGAGGQPPKPKYVNGCFAFIDRTAESASRTIVWDDALIFDPARCLRVRVGQTVSFEGNHENHPMAPKGGDVPNPVGPTVVFNEPGIFGYECIPHPSEMNGAIQVVPRATATRMMRGCALNLKTTFNFDSALLCPGAPT